MGYNREIYESAKSFLDGVRAKNIKEYGKKKKWFRDNYPDGAEIEREIAKTAVLVARMLVSGNSDISKITKIKEKNRELIKKLGIFLKEVGLPEDYLRPCYDCRVCLDTGYVDGVMCRCLKRILQKEAYNSLNKLSPWSLSSFDSFDLKYYDPIVKADPKGNKMTTQREKMSNIYNFCKDYAKKFNVGSTNILMMGETGLGKTHLSLAIANEVIRNGFGVIYVSVPSIVCKLEKERYRYVGGKTEDILLECDLLILDDLGTEYRTQFSNSAIYNIINSRLLCSKSTIISTNYTIQSIESDYSKRLVSRLWGEYRLLKFCGTDVRTQKAVGRVRMTSN